MCRRVCLPFVFAAHLRFWTTEQEHLNLSSRRVASARRLGASCCLDGALQNCGVAAAAAARAWDASLGPTPVDSPIIKMLFAACRPVRGSCARLCGSGAPSNWTAGGGGWTPISWCGIVPIRLRVCSRPVHSWVCSPCSSSAHKPGCLLLVERRTFLGNPTENANRSRERIDLMHCNLATNPGTIQPPRTLRRARCWRCCC